MGPLDSTARSWSADKHRLSRIVGVEFPFGHAFGMLDSAKGPDTRVDLDIEWPLDRKTAYGSWQPPEVAPIVKKNLDQIRKARRAAVEGTTDDAFRGCRGNVCSIL